MFYIFQRQFKLHRVAMKSASLGRVVCALRPALSIYCLPVDKWKEREGGEDGRDRDLLLLKFQFSSPEEGCFHMKGKGNAALGEKGSWKKLFQVLEIWINVAQCVNSPPLSFGQKSGRRQRVLHLRIGWLHFIIVHKEPNWFNSTEWSRMRESLVWSGQYES